MTFNSPHHQLNDTEIRLLSTILNFIDSQSWKDFKYAIISNTTAFQSFSRTISRSTQLNGMTM